MKVTVDKKANWHGKWINGKYISQIPGKGPEEASVKNNPKQPMSEAQRAQMRVQNPRLIEANRLIKEVKSDPEKLAVMRARFEVYCAKVGKTYVRKGKTLEHRFIDFLRREIMLEMSGGVGK